MAVIVGEHVLHPIGKVVNELLTPALDDYAFDEWPPHDALVGAGKLGSYTTHFPVSAPSRVVDGAFAHSYSDDFYHRVHIRPRVLALGNMVSTQVQVIEVWNAWLFPISLSSIDGVEDGMSLAGPAVFPLTFNALQLITWDASVTPDGPSVIDAIVTWNFADVPDAELHITGIRIVAWTLVPDWTDGIKERLAWATEILSSDRRDEQRRALRLSPRRSFDVKLFAEDRERTLFDLMMHGWGARVWAMPIWPDIQRITTPVALGAASIVCTTAGCDFRVGGLALLRGESAFLAEVVEIQTVLVGSLTLVRPTQNAWPAGTRLYPARTARFEEQPRARRLTDRAVAVDATFILAEASDWPAAALPAYRGFPVFDARPDETEELSGTFERMLLELDNASSIPVVLDAGDAAFATQAHRWVLDGVTQRGDFRSLLYTLRGRQVAVWVPTHSDDVRLTATVGSAALTATIENIGYARFGLGQLGRRDIRIELYSGTVLYRRITNAAGVDASSEQLSIDTALGVTVTPGDVRRISFMMLARSDSDVTEIQHVTDVQGVATSRKIFVGVPDA